MKLTWRSECASIFGAAMEAAWLSPVLLLFTYTVAQSAAVIVGLPLFVLLYLARFAARYLTEAELDLGRSRLLLAYLAAGSLLVAVKVQNYAAFSWLSADWLRRLASDISTASPAAGPLAVTVATVAYAWWRGLRVSSQGQHPTVFFQQFQFGLLAVAASAFLGGRVGYSTSFVPWIFWFFFWGLLAVAVTRLEEIARNRSTAVEPYWLPILFGVIVLVLLGGGIVSLAYSHELIAALRAILQPVARAFELLYGAFVTIVTILLLPFAYIMQYIIAFLMSFANPDQTPIRVQTNPFEQLPEQMRRNAVALPLPLAQALRWILVILILVALFKLLERMLRRRRVVVENGVEEIHESVWSRADLWASLRALWRRILTALGIGRQKVAAHPFVPTTPQERAAYSVRQIYQRLLEMAARLGRPRPVTRTPYEFLGDLTMLLPASQADLQAITDAYVRARYGSASTAETDVETAQQAWQRVKQEGAQVKQNQIVRNFADGRSDLPQ